MTLIPVKGAVLEWARKFRGLSETDAASRLGIEVTELRDFENERQAPTLGQFEDFAAQYRLPQATLFLKSPPSAPTDPVDFRSIDGNRARVHSFDFNVALSEIRNLLFQIERVVSDDEEFVAPSLPQLTLQDDPSIEGERERRRLGITVDEQLGWKSSKGFSNWRTALEKRGVLVFQAKFPINDGRGFTLYESPDTPTVIINKEDMADVAKSFTVWHEYAHLLLRRPGVSDQKFSDPTEAFCNRFAAAFLIPTEALRALLPVWPNSPVEWKDADIKRWAGRLKVSQRALAIRLEQLGLAPEGFGDRFAWGPPKKKPKSDGGDQIATHLSEIGFTYTQRVLSALDRGVIDQVAAVEALGMGENHLQRARDYVAKRLEPVPVAS
jgi:Zn-dependent peptidase ImmA (M78 family)